MQGFNRWIPPDYDPKKHFTLNDYHGKKALGDRERKRDQGVLVTRFELPFNIWCGTCEGHIGMGVRYNAEKKKIGMYYSTPMYSFRCKCHLCGGWFEIQTDPKNTRYVVVSGARQKDEDWDPEENGGFAIHDTDPNKPPEDPLTSLEKSTAAQKRVEEVIKPRIESLQDLSERYNADPSTQSARVRKKFREEKKLDKRRREEEDDFKTKYSLHSDLKLVPVEDVAEEAKEVWAKEQQHSTSAERKRRRLESDVGPIHASGSQGPSGSAGPSRSQVNPHSTSSALKSALRSSRSFPSLKSQPKQSLASALRLNTLKRTDPFLNSSPSLVNRNPLTGLILRK